MSRSDTAILIFTKSASEEVLVKKFVDRKKVNLKIARRFVKKTIQTAENTGLPTYTIFSDSQKGNSFGERFSNAIQDILDKGFHKVLAIGSDCPELTTDQLQQANHQLSEKSLVIGPDYNGGVYLIGISKTKFNRNQFSQLSWETNQLRECLVNYSDFTEVICLEHLRDINSFQDLKAVGTVKDNLSDILLFIKSVLASSRANFLRLVIPFFQRYISKYKSLRAPPIGL